MRQRSRQVGILDKMHADGKIRDDWISAISHSEWRLSVAIDSDTDLSETISSRKTHAALSAALVSSICNSQDLNEGLMGMDMLSYSVPLPHVCR